MDRCFRRIDERGFWIRRKGIRCQGDWMDSRAVSSRGRPSRLRHCTNEGAHCLSFPSPPSTLCANSDLRGSLPDIRICYNGNIGSFQIGYMLIQIRNADSFSAYIYIYIYLSTTTTTTICRGRLRKGNKAEGKTYQINSIDPALISCPQPVVTCKSKRKLVRPSSCVTMAEVSEPAARTKGKGKKKRRAIPPKPSSSCRKKWSVAASNVVDIERERKREQLAGLPRAPASFLASRRVCKLPRGRRTMVIPMEDWPCTLCRPLYATRTCW